jgi:hypothetical protein
VDAASLALKIATGTPPSAIEAIKDLIQYEMGTTAHEALLKVEVSVGEHRVSVAVPGHGMATITREEALADIRDGSCLLGSAFRKLYPDIAVDWSISCSTLWQQREAVRSAQPRISVLPAEFSEPPSFERLRKAVGGHPISAIVGPSSSGKTVILNALSSIQQKQGGNVVWINLADPDVGLPGFLLELATRTIPPIGSSYVIMDDVQSAPVLARRFLELRRSLPKELTWVLGSWPDALDLLEQFLTSNQLIRTEPNDVCRRIISRSVKNSEDGQRLLGLANGDALVAELGRDYYRRHHRVPSSTELAASAYEVTGGRTQLSQPDLQTLRAVACLGMFEIDADVRLFSARERVSIDRLVGSGILRRNGQFVIFGHRTVARLVVRHVDRTAPDLAKTTAVQLSVDYLRRAGANQIKQTLDRLDLFGVSDDHDQFGAAFLAQCWTSLRVLVRHLIHQVHADPTWGDNIASAVFAADAFAELGMHDEWATIASYVRSRWALPAGECLPVPTSPDTAEFDDFVEIQRRMNDEDGLGETPGWIKGEDVDLQEFHRTWVLGLLLGFEGKALDGDVQRLSVLRSMAARSISPEGAFYPARVPWVTARVLIGLSTGGDTVATSAAAASAASWLRTRPPVGPCHFGVWRSGTGTWNTDLQVTALVLLALGRAGVDPGDTAVRGGLNYLRAGRNEWYRPGKEIDAAQAVEAALVLGGHWRDYEPELRGLLNWAQDSRSWASARALASVTQDESSKIPAVVSALIEVIWETVRAELPLLLQGIVDDGDATGGASRDAWLLLIERRLDQVDDAIRQNVRDRELLVSRGRASAETLAALIEWRARADANADNKSALRALRLEFDAQSAERLREQVNELGLSLLGPAWTGMEVDRCEDLL